MVGLHAARRDAALAAPHVDASEQRREARRGFSYEHRPPHPTAVQGLTPVILLSVMSAPAAAESESCRFPNLMRSHRPFLCARVAAATWAPSAAGDACAG